MRAVLHTRCHQRTAIKRKRPGRAEHHARVFRKPLQGRWILCISHQNIGTFCARTTGGFDRFKLVSRTPGQRPAQRLAVRVFERAQLRKIRNRLPTDEAAGTVQDHVIFSI